MQKEPITIRKKAVLLTVITRAEFNEFKYIMKKADPQAFITISENVHIIGRFVGNRRIKIREWDRNLGIRFRHPTPHSCGDEISLVTSFARQSKY